MKLCSRENSKLRLEKGQTWLLQKCWAQGYPTINKPWCACMFDSKGCWGPFPAPGCPQDLYQPSLVWRLRQAGGCGCPASRADGIQDPCAALLLPEPGGLLPQLLRSCQWFSCAESSLSSLFSFWYRHPPPPLLGRKQPALLLSTLSIYGGIWFASAVVVLGLLWSLALLWSVVADLQVPNNCLTGVWITL